VGLFLTEQKPKQPLVGLQVNKYTTVSPFLKEFSYLCKMESNHRRKVGDIRRNVEQRK